MYKLLIVDDEIMIAENLRTLIDYSELNIGKIEIATDFDEAVNKAMEFRPDIALLDVCIHDRKGFEIIEYLNKFQLETKYVIISGYDDFKYAKEAVKYGARNYILKPVEREELKKTLEKIIVKDFNGEVKNADKENVDEILHKDCGSYSKLTQKVIAMVWQNYKQGLSLKEIGDKFMMNSTYLGQLFLKETGMKFSEYLMLYRLNEAKKLIEMTDDKIAVIAEEVGYSNVNYFYTQFQQVYNASPLDFRRK